MAILLPGGAGHIGSHTAVELLNAGKEIVILDIFSNKLIVLLFYSIPIISIRIIVKMIIILFSN